MCEPVRATTTAPVRHTALLVLAAFGAAGTLRLMATVAGWASLAVPALLAVAVVGTFAFGALTHHRAGVRAEQARRAQVLAPGRAVVRVLPAATNRPALEQARLSVLEPSRVLPPMRALDG